MGLVHLLPGEPARFAASAPDVALDALLVDRERQLQRAREHAERLAATYHAYASEPGPLVEVVTGHNAVQQRLSQIWRGTRHELRCLDRPPYLDLHGTAADGLDLLAAGISCRTIYERASLEPPDAFAGIEELIRAGEQARVLPELPMKLYLADGRLAVLPLQPGPSTTATLIVHPCSLLDALGTLFEGLWQRALPLNLPTGHTTSTRPARPARSARSARHDTDDDRRLIALLLSGLTDEAIAHQLGLGYRTVQRRVAALLEALGVHTRFQAGVQISLRETAQDASST